MSDGSYVDLDEAEALDGLDSENVLQAVEGFAGQMTDAWAIGTGATGLPEAEGVDSVVVLGMGGSGVSGDVLQSVAGPRLLIPVHVIKSYGPLPEWVGRNTLVFAVSYSGSTEETVAALEDAHQKGARIVTVASGGPLADLAQEYGIAHVSIPSGLQPRASLPFLALPIFAVLESMGFLVGTATDVEEAVEVVGALAARCAGSVPEAENPAKELASRLKGKITVVYGGYGIGAAAAMRFKSDLNEYGKAPAFWNFFPELNHNEIVGWNKVAEVTSQHVALVLLRDRDEHPRISLRFEITERLISDKVSDVIEVESKGVSALARMMSLIFVTQMAAIYVGLAHGVDPGPVEVIQALKAELKER